MFESVTMQAHRLLLFFVVYLIAIHLSWQQITEPSDEASPTAEPCKTARNISGLCVIRKLCDYGTPAIDKTLYATKGYVRPCTLDEVCCPSEYIAPVAKEDPQKEFTFDDD